MFLICIDCPVESNRYATINSLEIHIATNHVDGELNYECSLCPRHHFITETMLYDHYTHAHGQSEVVFSLELSLKSFLVKLQFNSNANTASNAFTIIVI